MFKKIVLGISGGVDSAVSAYILKNKGFTVTGVFMKNWDIPDETGFCNADADFEDAKSICDKFNIPIIHVDYVKEYWNLVFSDLISDYESGYTPNPDILCNKFIKFNFFFKYAIEELKADAIATGHYALTSFGPFLEHYRTGTNVNLLMPEDKHKDQTFFLSQINQSALRKTMFPIGMYKKSYVRKIAKQLDLNVAEKRDSTGICFIGKRNFQKFISEYVKDQKGKFVDIETGEKVGEHLGLHHWTVGQGAKLGGYLKPYFIAYKDLTSNTIYVAKGTDNPFMFTQLFYTKTPHWIDETQDKLRRSILKCQFRFQHTKPLVNCTIFLNQNGLMVVLEKPLRAITPGQYAVFYLENQCLGSARIFEVGPSIALLSNETNYKIKNSKS